MLSCIRKPFCKIFLLLLTFILLAITITLVYFSLSVVFFNFPSLESKAFYDLESLQDPEVSWRKNGKWNVCPDVENTLVVIHSSLFENQLRNQIRNTWGSYRLSQRTKAKVVFVISYEEKEDHETLWSQEREKELERENNLHGDILFGSLPSDLKELIWMSWTKDYCSTFSPILKLNSNTFMDLISFSQWDFSFGAIYLLKEEGSYVMTNTTRDSLLVTWNSLSRLPIFPSFHFLDFLVQGTPDVEFRQDYLKTSFGVSSWDSMVQNYHLQNLEPVIVSDFKCSSYEDYFLIPKFDCIKMAIETLVVIHTHPEHTDYRSIIRSTWGDSRLFPLISLKPIFFTGRSWDPVVEKLLRQESEVYDDLVITNYVDTYKNLTFKALSWMKWTREYCSNVKTVVKSDDDIMIDVFNMTKYIRHNISTFHRSKIHCYHWRYGKVERNDSIKHFISQTEFEGKRYPNYCSGSAFILTPQISDKLLTEFISNPSYIWVDDVYITGILAKRAKIKLKSISKYFSLLDKDLDGIMKSKQMLFAHLSGRNRHPKRIYLWNQILKLHNISLT